MPEGIFYRTVSRSLQILHKRLIGVVTVKNGWAVQSFGYNSYLPLGRPEVLVENLDRWGADEILVQVIDRSLKKLGPDFHLIEKIGDIGVSTPIIYGGGIRHQHDAVGVIQKGADRISLDNIFFENPNSVREIAHFLGSQALIGSLPVHRADGVLKHYNYVTKSSDYISKEIMRLLEENLISELLISDWLNEGSSNKFNIDLLKAKELSGNKLIAFGGIGDPLIGAKVVAFSNVSAVAVGNSFSYKEHAIQAYSKKLKTDHLRPAYFRDEHTYNWNQ